MSLPFSVAWFGFLGASRHLSRSDRVLSQLNPAYPRAANALSGAIAGTAFATHMLAGSFLAAISGAGALALATRTVTWITASHGIASTIGQGACIYASMTGSVGIIISRVVFEDSCSNFSDRTAVWITNLASISHWQLKLVNVQAYFGYLTAEKLNNLDNAQLRRINSWTLQCLQGEEIEKLLPRVINGLSPDAAYDLAVRMPKPKDLNGRACREELITGEELNALSAFEIRGLDSKVLTQLPDEEIKKLLPRVINRLSPDAAYDLAVRMPEPKDLNDRACREELITGEELNALSAFEIRGLDSEVLTQLPDEEIKKLLPHVINGLSPITITGIATLNVIMKLPDSTLCELKPYVFNNLPIDPAAALSEDARKKLSVKPVRWKLGMSTKNIHVPSFENLYIAGKRSIWVENDSYPNVPEQICRPVAH